MTLPKGYSNKEVTKFRVLQSLMILLSIFLAGTGVFVGLAVAGQETSSEEHKATVEFLKIFSVSFWIVGVPLLIFVIMKRRKLQLTEPTGFTQMYYRCREPHQCTICHQHPVSKKYHIKNVHKLKNVDIDNYFKDCGCAKCARYDKGGEG